MKNKLRTLFSGSSSNKPSQGLGVLYDKYYGHEISVSLNDAVDLNLNPIPWFTYPCIDFLKQFSFHNQFIFEWGAGNSSLFFAKNGAKVLAVESDIDWFNQLKNQSVAFLELLHLEDANYYSCYQDKGREADIVIIDGIYRKECVLEVTALVNPKQLIILDNSDRHPDLCELLRLKNFVQIDFIGPGPINNYTWVTSLFFIEYRFKPLTVQPIVPKGGGF